jgi:hypothetical protein
MHWSRFDSVERHDINCPDRPDAQQPEAPHEQHHLSTSDAIAQHAPTPEAPQGDDLVRELRDEAERQVCDGRFHQARHLLLVAANARESDAERIRELEAEVARRKGDPVTRLHNLCEGMEQDRHDSPYSAEAWEAQDAAYREKCAELAASRERERHLEREIEELRGGK